MPMNRSPVHMPSRRGFTLVETLVVIAIITVLVFVSFRMLQRARERAAWAVDVGNMRTIGTAIVGRGMENSRGIIYTKADVGNSSYRAFEDPLSLCQVLKDYVSSEAVWRNPAAHRRLKPYRNSYAWSINATLLSTPVAGLDSPDKKILLWNNFCYTMTSVNNVSEGSTGGPPRASTNYYAYPWNRGKDANWLYLDLHIETF